MIKIFTNQENFKMQKKSSDDFFGELEKTPHIHRRYVPLSFDCVING